MSGFDIEELIGWAKAGGRIALGHFNRVVAERKADRSLVTAADREVEVYLREQIARRYPGHGIMGEELGAQATEREFVWLLDPIDGTGVFLGGLPTWCVSLGLVRAGQPYLGVVYLPVSDDCYAADERGAYWNGAPIQVSDHTRIDRNDWIALPSAAHLDFELSFPGKMRAFGSIAAHLCYVARGSAVASLQGGPGGGMLWDVAAGLAILRAAGGIAQTLDGAPLDTLAMLGGARDEAPWLATTPALAAQVAAGIRPRWE
jgi:fructose-1,6-bisphosphatase/inositol monophosphatase family enzyme